MVARLRRYFDVRPGEGRRVLFSFLYVAAVAAAFLLARPLRNGLFLQQYGAYGLVYVYAAVPIVLSLFVPVYARVAARFGSRTVAVGTLIFFSSNVLLFWYAFRFHSAAIGTRGSFSWFLPGAFYVWVNCFGVIAPVQAWSFASDWKAPGNYSDFWEPVFHSVLANGALYVPGAGGTIFRVNKSTGDQIARINPFGIIDPNTYTAGPISADSSGNLYYNVVKLQNGGSFYSKDSIDSWLVKVAPDNSATKVSYSVLTPGTPGPDDPCEISFSTALLPWPPSPTAVAPTVRCGPMRVALNIAPAIAPDGTIYTITRSHAAFANRSGYLVAVNPNLTLKWISSLNNRFSDGCGVAISQGGVLPPNGQPGGCRAGANFGVDPGVNHAGGGRVLDDASSSPTVAPDGSVFYGAYTRYNYAQGHLMHFSSSGAYLGAYRFGWDLTPGIVRQGSGPNNYSVVIKDNQYGEVGTYCDTEAFCPSDRTIANSAGYPEAYFVTQLDRNLVVQWRFQNTNTFSCSRQPDGSVTCVSDHPNGFEWCVNATVIDANGVVYANSEDGNLFAINPDGTLKQKIFQQLALGAAYTPASIGLDGKIYSQNAGHLFVAGN